MASDVFVFGTAQLAAPKGAAEHETMLLTTEEKRRFVDALADGSQPPLPVVWQHAGAEAGARDGFSAADGLFHAQSTGKVIGHVKHAMMDSQGRLMFMARLDWDAPETAKARELLQSGKPLGFSVGTNMLRGTAEVRDKSLDHVGLTDEPAYEGDPMELVADPAADGQPPRPASNGTWLHLATLTPATLVDKMREYLEEPGMYVPDPVRARYAAAEAFKQQALLAAQPPAEPAPSVTMSAPVTNTNEQQPAQTQQPAAAPPAEQRMSIEQAELELKALAQQVLALYATDPAVLSYEDITRARALDAQFEDVMKRAGIRLGSLPVDARKAMMRLTDVLDLYKQFSSKAIEQDQPTPETRKEVIENMHQRFVANSVFASATKIMQNARQQEEQLRREVEAKKKAEEEAAAAERESLQKRIRELESAAQQPAKKARVEESRPVAVLPAAAAAQAAELKPLSVGASRGTGGSGLTLDVYKRENTRAVYVSDDVYLRDWLPQTDKRMAMFEYSAPHALDKESMKSYHNVTQLLQKHWDNPYTAACVIDPRASEVPLSNLKGGQSSGTL